MAYEKTYPNRINWEDYPSTSTPLSAENLNKMDKGTFDQDVSISAISSRLDNLTYRISKLEDPFVCYGFHISGSESDPSLKVTYLEDAVGMTPAHMNFSTGVFDYGSWEDAFFMPKPCMLKLDGTVDYYLNPNNYTKKADGTASDVANTNYLGNAMMEWGQNGKKIWLKIVPDADDITSASVYIADKQIDNDFHDYSFHNSQGVSVDHFYTAIYNVQRIALSGYGYVYKSVSGTSTNDISSLSGCKSLCRTNNINGELIWDCMNYSDYLLITMLITLIGKSTDTSVVFGRGLTRIAGRTSKQPSLTSFTTGVHNDKGLFYGTEDEFVWNEAQSSTVRWYNAVKIFGMENWWGFKKQSLLGIVTSFTYEDGAFLPGELKCKFTYGTEDGSTVTDYNETGDGYNLSYIIENPTLMMGNGILSKMAFTGRTMFPHTIDGIGVDTYTENYADHAFWIMSSGNNTYTYTVGEGVTSSTSSSGYNDIRSSGAFANSMGYTNNSANGVARLVCRPLAST